MQSIAILCEAAEGERANYIKEVLANVNNSLVKVTLSYTIYKYDALLKDGNKYLSNILNEIRQRWGQCHYLNDIERLRE